MRVRYLIAPLLLLASMTGAEAASLMNVVEFGAAPQSVGGFYPQVAPFPPLATQQIDFTSGVTQSAALNARTAYVCVNVNTRAAIKVETASASAATTDWPMGVDLPWCFSVPKGLSYKISVIANP